MEIVGRLVSGIAHDFNNLLTVIAGNTDVLLRETDEADPRRTELVEIRRAAERAASLTHDLLAFARRENLRLRTIDIVAGLEGMRSEIENRLGDDATLEMDLGPGPARIRVDPELARRVALEVVSNARDAMSGDGHMRIEVRKVHVTPGSDMADRGLEPGHWVGVGYSDSGAGMTDDVKERAFHPFYTTKEGRSGLGLSTVYGLVKQTGGDVWIESSAGEGTTLWTYMPDADAQPHRVTDDEEERS